MSIETTIYGALGSLAGGRIFPDYAPTGTATPFITWQQIGGDVLNPFDGSLPGYYNSRIQFNAWADTRLQANQLMRQIEDLLRPEPINARPIGALIARAEPLAKTRGAQQDFTVWWATD